MKTRTMSETHATLDRLETQIEEQPGRINALYELLELHGILSRDAATAKGDAMHGLPHGRKRDRPPLTRWARGFHIGTATGV